MLTLDSLFLFEKLANSDGEVKLYMLSPGYKTTLTTFSSSFLVSHRVHLSRASSDFVFVVQILD